MSEIMIQRCYVYRCVRDFFGNNSLEAKRRVYQQLPRAVMTNDSKINRLFLFEVASGVANIFPGQEARAADLIGQLNEAKLVGDPPDFGEIYAGIVKQRVPTEKLAALARSNSDAQNRLLALQSMVNELGVDSEKNIEITMRCARKIFGFSGVRVYDLNLERGTWHHRGSDGEQGVSRFLEPTVPPESSEKTFLTRLLRGEVSAGELEEARAAKLYELVVNGGSTVFYIPDRMNCAFVEREQVIRDERGDRSQGRDGYGEGKARQIIYLVIGKQGDGQVDVVQITNWASGRDLFKDQLDKDRQILLLNTFGTSVARVKEIASTNQKLESETITDELTGLNNRRYYVGKIEREVLRTRASRQALPLGLLIIDIDHFKAINDAPDQGHPVGDKILREISALFLTQLRGQIDSISRLGGDEFVAILPETNAEGLKIVAERIRAAVEAHHFMNGSNRVKVTVSIGGSLYTPPVLDPSAARPTPAPDVVDDTVGGLYHRADKALYSAKKKRNSVCI